MDIHGALPRFWSSGAHTLAIGTATLTYRDGLLDEPTATFMHDINPQDPVDLKRTLGTAEEVTGHPCRRIFLDMATPAWVEAELIARDWEVAPTLLLVMPRGVNVEATNPRGTAIRPVGDSDWTELAELFRADHEEEDAKFGRPIRSMGRTSAIVQARRQLTLPAQYFLAEGDGVTGFVAGWSDPEGLGLIEDVYVAPKGRHHGLASMLIAIAVAHARSEGAGPIVIGAEVNDTVKHLYVRLGFIPSGVLRTASRP